jgi:DNA polymerase-3 subunit epsilon
MSTTFVDTETTSLWDYHSPDDAPHQPRIVQLAAMLVDGEGEPVGSCKLFIKPDGWTIPPEATAVHGITTEKCEQDGIPMADALKHLQSMMPASGTLAVYNLSFDRNLLIREATLAGMSLTYPPVQVCVMEMATPICKLPGKYGYKWPKLAEAYEMICGKALTGAHDAMADVVACKEVYFAAKRARAEQLAVPPLPDVKPWVPEF